MTVKKLNKREILQETVEYYSKNTKRRAVSSNGCVYNANIYGLEKHCAVGRCFTDKFKDMGEDLPGNSDTGVTDIAGVVLWPDSTTPAKSEGNQCLDFMLQEKYQGHSIKFWMKLQMLHDQGGNWDSKGLTDLGKRSVETINEKILDGELG